VKLLCMLLGHDWCDVVEALYSLHFYCGRCPFVMAVRKAPVMR